MSVRPIWNPSRTITITVSSYNSGQARMVRIAGPTGEAGMAPVDPKDWKGMISWALDIAAGEMGVALGELDSGVGLIERLRSGLTEEERAVLDADSSLARDITQEEIQEAERRALERLRTHVKDGRGVT